MLTDMVGYSFLTQRDEKLALDLAHEQDQIIRTIAATFGGHTVKSLGDGALVEFASALDAVRCALQIQEAVGQRNSAAGGEHITLRIGIHLGDVVHWGEDVFGDAVNIVARIEPHADHGGVCVSQQVYDQVHNKLEASFESIGSPKLKNIETAIQLYKIIPTSAHAPPELGTVGPPPDESLRRIVVLPFANISPDPNDDYFADGMTEELIEKLAHVSGLRVIARTTAMHYKNSQETALEIGRALRVAMVLECSVRKAGNQIRITAQLIETSSEEHLWAARYDRELHDIFAIQDDISGQIADAMFAHVTGLGATGSLSVARAEQDTSDMEAYTDFLQGRKMLRDKVSEDTIRQALTFFDRAIARDPAFSRARVGAAECYLWLGSEGSLPLADSTKKAREELTTALAKNDALAEAHSVLGGLMLGEDNLAGAAREAHRAIELNPSFSDPYRWLAQLEAGKGNIDETVRLLEEAYQLDPLDVNVIAFLGRAYFYAGREAEALAHWDETASLVAFRTSAHRTEYYLSHQDYARAEESFHEMERLRPDSIWVLTYRGFLAAQQGDQETARRCIKTLDELGRDGVLTCFFAGFIHFALNDMDEFFQSLERAFELHSLPLLELMYSPLYERARGDPRYHDLLRRQLNQN
jgi:TolB-like protein/Flp pilus assembly protein TadD